jgi:hypothetical protein
MATNGLVELVNKHATLSEMRRDINEQYHIGKLDMKDYVKCATEVRMEITQVESEMYAIAARPVADLKRELIYIPDLSDIDKAKARDFIDSLCDNIASGEVVTNFESPSLYDYNNRHTIKRIPCDHVIFADKSSAGLRGYRLVRGELYEKTDRQYIYMRYAAPIIDTPIEQMHANVYTWTRNEFKKVTKGGYSIVSMRVLDDAKVGIMQLVEIEVSKVETPRMNTFDQMLAFSKLAHS